MPRPREPVHIIDSEGRVRYPRLWRVGHRFEFDRELDPSPLVITAATVQANGWTVRHGWFTRIPAGVTR